VYHFIMLLKQRRVATCRVRPIETSCKSDQIVAPGSLGPLGGYDRDRESQSFERLSSLSPKLGVLAVVELFLPALGFLLGLQLWNGSLWWLLTGAGTLLSVLLGYIFRSHIELHPLDLSHP
jgi:hypothetical protein